MSVPDFGSSDRFVLVFKENGKEDSYNKRVSGKCEPDTLPVKCASFEDKEFVDYNTA